LPIKILLLRGCEIGNRHLIETQKLYQSAGAQPGGKRPVQVVFTPIGTASQYEKGGTDAAASVPHFLMQKSEAGLGQCPSPALFRN